MKKDNSEQKAKHETKHETTAEDFANKLLVIKISASFIVCSVFALKVWLGLQL